MRLRWKCSALADLGEIAAYIAKENSEAARKVISEVRKQTQVLSSQPQIGRRGRVSDTYELVITRYPYIVTYEITGESLDVLAVVHMSKLWPEKF